MSQAKRAELPELSGEWATPGAVEAHAHTRVRAAERQAQALVEAAQRKVAAQLEEGYRDGHAQGRAEALAEARDRVRQALETLRAAAARAHLLEEELRCHGERLIVDLALTVAERFLRARLGEHRDEMLARVREAVRLVPDGETLIVRVHPAEQAVLADAAALLQDTAPGAAGVRVVPEPALQPGECTVEACGCLAEATVNAALAEARCRLLGEGA